MVLEGMSPFSAVSFLAAVRKPTSSSNCPSLQMQWVGGKQLIILVKITTEESPLWIIKSMVLWNFGYSRDLRYFFPIFSCFSGKILSRVFFWDEIPIKAQKWTVLNILSQSVFTSVLKRMLISIWWRSDQKWIPLHSYHKHSKRFQHAYVYKVFIVWKLFKFTGVIGKTTCL